MRGATRSCKALQMSCRLFQSTHPMRGATILRGAMGSSGEISIHAPHAGCDVALMCHNNQPVDFNPRTPCGVRPYIRTTFNDRDAISIHAPHAGCDLKRLCRRQFARQFQSTHPMRGATTRYLTHLMQLKNFNPRTPCGVRRVYVYPARQLQKRFQSTHPMRGATSRDMIANIEADNFNPRTPCGVRRARFLCLTKSTNFNPRTPCGVRHAQHADLFRC